MGWFLELGNRYAKKSNWKDFALVKFCLFSMGILAGICVDPKHKKITAKIAGVVFFTTYIPLMVKVFLTAMDMEK